MKKIILAIVLSLYISITKAQIISDPVTWTVETEKLAGDQYRILLSAEVRKGWHIYSQHQPENAISVPTSFEFGPKGKLTLSGKTTETGKKELQSIPEAGIKQFYYAGKVQFVQTVRVKSKSTGVLSVKVNYMACTNERCLPETTKQLTCKLGK